MPALPGSYNRKHPPILELKSLGKTEPCKLV